MGCWHIHGLKRMGFPYSTDTLDPLKLEPFTHGTAVKAYLIELSTFQQQPLLGSYDQGKLCLNDCGLIVAGEWVRSATKRSGIDLDLWNITPTSLKSIVFLQVETPFNTQVPGPLESQKPWLLSSFVTSFKASAAKRINLCRNQLGQSVWQSSYDELLIDDPRQLSTIRNQLQEQLINESPSPPA